MTPCTKKTIKWELLLSSLLLFSAVGLEAASVPVTNTSDSGPGSFRDAILNYSSGDTIDFQPATSGGTITLLSPLPIISQDITTINGPVNPVTIDGQGLYSALMVVSPTVIPTLTANNLIIQNALVSGAAGGNSQFGGGGGGGGAFGGGVLCFGNVNLTNVQITGNTAQGGPGDSTNNLSAGQGGGGGGGANCASGSGIGGSGGLTNKLIPGGGAGGGGGLLVAPAGDGNGSAGTVTGTGAGGSVGGAETGYSSLSGGAAGADTAALSGGGGSGAAVVAGNIGIPGTLSGGGAQSNSLAGAGGGGAAIGALLAGAGGDTNGASGGAGGGGRNLNLGGTGGSGGNGSPVVGIGGGGGGGGDGDAAGGLGGSGFTGGGNGGAGVRTSIGGGGAGGGGGGLGGGIFVALNTTTTFTDGGFSGNQALGGAGGTASALVQNGTNGAGFGQDIYVQGGRVSPLPMILPGTLNFVVNSSLEIPTAIESSNFFSGLNILPGGIVNKDGPGILTLNGDNTFDSTTVVAGTLNYAAGSTSQAATQVNSGATLKGTGTIFNDVDNFGTITPGNSIGTLAVLGATFESNSIFQVEISPSATSLLVVGADGVSFADTTATVAVTPDPGAYTLPMTYTILTSSGGITGTFNPTVTIPTGFAGSLIYDPMGTFIQLLLSMAPPFNPSLASIVSTGNPGSVASYLDSLNPTPGSDLANVINALSQITDPSELRSALNQLHESPFAVFSLAIQNNTLHLQSAIAQRMDFLQKNCLCKGLPIGKLTLWADATGDAEHQSDIGQNVGYSAPSGLGILGLDYKAQENFYIGASGAYSYTHLDWNHGRVDGHVQSYYGTLYSSWSQCHFFWDTAVTGAVNYNHAKRHIHFTTISRTAHHHHRSNELAVYTSMGVPFDWKSVAFKPFVAFDWTKLWHHSFHESGAGSLDLAVNRQKANLFRSELGLLVDKCYTFSRAKLIPSIKAAAAHEQRWKGKRFTAALAGQDSTFHVRGIRPKRTVFIPGASLTTLFSQDRAAFSLRYDGAFGHRYRDNSLSAEVAYTF
jgi:uncharacterized protein with beta-barrel porin domain